MFDLDLGVKVTRNFTQCPLQHVIYASTKFEVATSNGLGEDTITRNVTDGRTTDRLWYEINIPYFSNEKAGKIISQKCSSWGPLAKLQNWLCSAEKRVDRALDKKYIQMKSPEPLIQNNNIFTEMVLIMFST